MATARYRTNRLTHRNYPYSLEHWLCDSQSDLHCFSALRRASIREHRHYLGEREGREIGLDEAEADWILHGFGHWLSRTFCDRRKEVREYFKTHYNGTPYNKVEVTRDDLRNMLGEAKTEIYDGVVFFKHGHN